MIALLSEYRQSDLTSLSHMKNGRPNITLEPAVIILNSGEPSRARTCDPLIKSAVKGTASGYGSYDLLTFVTGCSRQRVHLLPPITATFAVVLSQVCLNRRSTGCIINATTNRLADPTLS
jgi:hypothetical protein